MDADTPLRATRTEQGRDDGALFVSNFLPTTTQEELSEALEPFGKYEQFVMRMSFAFLSQGSGLSKRTFYHRSPEYAYIIYLNEDHVEEISSVYQ